jgi:hypothetical protein
LLNLHLKQGERFKQRFIFQRFNYETMKVELIDLSGWSVKGGIYEQSPDQDDPPVEPITDLDVRD